MTLPKQTLRTFLEGFYAGLNTLMHAINAGEIEPIVEANASVRNAVLALPRAIDGLPAGDKRNDLAALEAAAVEQYQAFQPHLDAALADGEWKDEIAAIDAGRVLQATLRVGISEFAGKHGLKLDPPGGTIPTAAQIEAREMAE